MVSNTPRTRFSRFRSTLGLMLALPLAATVLALAACLPVAVGDPERSEADPALVGPWLAEINDTNRQMFLVHRYDERTYMVQMFQYQMHAGRVEPGSTSQFKAWLTELGGKQFITMEPFSARELALPNGEGPLHGLEYFVARITPGEDTVDVRALNPKSNLLDSVHSREEAERVIQENVGDDGLYVDRSIELRKLEGYDEDEVRSVLNAFNAG